MFHGRLHCLLRFKLARNNEDDVVRSIILFVKGAEPIDRHAFNIGAISDNTFSVVVPFIRVGHDPLQEDIVRRIFARFKLVANDSHF